MIYHCCDQNRRNSVDGHPTLNGIDWIEVLDLDAPDGAPRQQTLLVRLLKPVPAGLSPTNIFIDGGERIRDVGVLWVAPADTPPGSLGNAERDYYQALDEADHVLVIRTDTNGDFSTYRLHLVQDVNDDAPPPGIDPMLATIDFSFKVECPNDLDCKPDLDCPPVPHPDPNISYLARDYESLRRLVLDRLRQNMPAWQGHLSPADIVHTLAELIAYVGDLQHYELDAIATEAYMRTARQRTSLRRHGLLVDYRMHDGCNARTWLHVRVGAPGFDLPDSIRFLTRVGGVPNRVTPHSPEARLLRDGAPVVFEPIHRPTLFADHNDFLFYTWGDAECCLPIGATRATLAGHWPDLAAGDVLVFREQLGPLTGAPEDADPRHRHAVRLTSVTAFDGPQPLEDPLNTEQITQIEWGTEDALPFALCLSSITDETHGETPVEDVSIALGNIVLVDHGETIAGEDLGAVPPPLLHYPPNDDTSCDRAEPEPIPARFHPLLDQSPVTQQGTVLRSIVQDGVRRSERVPFNPEASARAAMIWNTGDAVPAVTLAAGVDNWTAELDLLNSRGTDPHFVLETEYDSSARVRFGDDTHGQRPDSGTAFLATYRVGNGAEGNVGADSIAHALTADGRILAVNNPMPAFGGTEPETAAELRRRAPVAYRTQERAVTPADYEAMTERLPDVQNAAAGLRWTGSWHTVFVTVDRENEAPVDATYAEAVVDHLERFRMAGHDLRINDPVYISLELDLLVCVDSSYFAADVRAGLLEVLGSTLRADGQRGLFHPDNFSFGQTVYLSPVYAAARKVPGVTSVQITRFHRQGQFDPAPLTDGYMTLGELEIARLANNRNFPEHGVLRLNLVGGK
ncbi:putative baseplate assembly protein [Ruegeria sp. 2205SS24-7]|uniref:putative baseplate assembly protein n=1 Tax=Ruegeria discodermiae TaxID=3064389 RepID=UPI0027420583|nr:putative baseplate assembly protein [Ruegeria sp. 2205SS24-7]MDP5220846.1 putative baseplate assembly protein [Ruegeria sp. 2205SS24-7]